MVLGRVQPMHRQVLLLAAQVLVQTASTLVTVGGLAGGRLLVPSSRRRIASMFLGTVATIVPATIPGFQRFWLLGTATDDSNALTSCVQRFN
jgi:hypothetical protein